jgi:hypothetical protein
MRLAIILIVSSLLILASLAAPALAVSNQAAQVIGMPFITTDNVVYSMPVSFGGFLCIEFNSTYLKPRDLEKMDIDFPLSADIPGANIALGPTNAGVGASVNGISPGASTTANVLPFGPVDLAFPNIRQTVDQSIDYQDTYFFTDTIGVRA